VCSWVCVCVITIILSVCGWIKRSSKELRIMFNAGRRRAYAPKRSAYSAFGAAGRYAKRIRGAGGYAAARAGGMRRLRRRNVRTAGFLGIEKKFYDSELAGTAIAVGTAGSEVDPAGNLKCLNAITQGDGESSRDGRKCMLKSVQVRGNIYVTGLADQADAASGLVVRVLMVHDKQTNGAQLNAEDVLKDAGADINDMINMQYSRRFRILYDRTFSLRPVSTMTDGAATGSIAYEQMPFKIFKSLNMPVNYTGTTEDIANITDNSLHMIAIAGGAGANITYTARVRFVG